MPNSSSTSPAPDLSRSMAYQDSQEFDDETWRFYFATIAGWSVHPGRTRPGTPIITLEQAAQMADDMLAITKIRRP